VAQVAGSGSVVTDLVVPYNGHQLKGSELEGQCEPWYAQNLYNIYITYIYTIYIYYTNGCGNLVWDSVL
jgi:hypothetical protein